jgi:ABC-type transport system involved in cytochrome bd biosynthesis fused ATPase/permease subunit
MISIDYIANRLKKRKKFEIHQPTNSLAIELTNKEFFANENAILKNLELKIEKSKLIALIGTSSSGKSVNHHQLTIRIY